MAPDSLYTFSAGWDLENVRHGHVNNMGYAAPFDYQRGGKVIVVLGDSFVENLMNDYSESLQGYLPALLHEPQLVLNFGTAGGNLAHDLGVAALVGASFRVTTAIILITRGSFVGGFNTSPGYYRWAPGSAAGVELVPERQRGRVARFLRKLALVRYVRANLEADFRQLLAPRGRAVTEHCTSADLSAGDNALVDFIVRELPSRLHLPPSQVILIFDSDRDAIYAPDKTASCETRDNLALGRLAQRASASGFGVVDMDPIFRAAFKTRREHFDYKPVDGHWNGLAHRLAAQAVARYINAQQGTAPTYSSRVTSTDSN
jgi:hypothetical protein